MNALTPDVESAIRLGLFTVMFALLALAELRWPRRNLSCSRAQRWTANLGLSLLNSLVLRMLIPVAGVAGAIWAADSGLGLFNH